MPWTNVDAANLVLLAMYAEDTFETARQNNKDLSALTVADVDPRVLKDWNVLGLIFAKDILVNDQNEVGFSDTPVFYGFLLSSQNPAAPALIVVLRGTEDILEWGEDAKFEKRPHPLGGNVEDGFYSIYCTMTYVATGSTPAQVATGIGAAIGANPVTVTGHSLGSALATYLALDLSVVAGKGPAAVSMCIFASPHAGDVTFAGHFYECVPNHMVFNYSLDIVPTLPALFGYTSLPNLTKIPPNMGVIRFSPACNHHALCYAWLLNPPSLGVPVPAVDVNCAACVKNSPTSLI